MNRFLPLFLALMSLALSPVHSAPPNLLLIIADDCTYRDLEVYGGQAKTPHLNKLAAEGMKMTRCFQAAPMCSPTRHCLYTGIYPVKSGAYPNHTFAHEWVKSIAHYLQATGYSTHLSGKTHINPITVFPFEYSTLKKENNPDPAVFEQVLKTSSESQKPFPFAKWTCYDAGLQSACIARWPGQVQPGSESAALVEYVDIVPTFLEAAGIACPEILDGRSFLPVLKGQADQHKDVVFGLQTTRGINAGSEFFGVRSVRNDRYRYIRNFTPEATFECAATNDLVYKSWQSLAKEGDTTAQALVTAYQHRPAEELFDCQKDPWNRTNLIADETLASVRQDLSTRLNAWMKQQGDQGQATEMAALERMPRSQKEPKKAKKKKKKAVQ